MKKTVGLFILMGALCGKLLSQITGPSSIAYGQTLQYTFSGTPDAGSVVWSSVDSDVILTQQTMSSVFVHVNTYDNTASSSFYLDIKWTETTFVGNNLVTTTKQDSMEITRAPYISGPTYVYPQENNTFLINDPAGYNDPYHQYNWSSSNCSNASSVLAWHNNNVVVTWNPGGGPFTVNCDYTNSSSGLFGNLSCTKQMKLRTPVIGDQGGISLCDVSPRTYAVTPIAGATEYVWTVPSGWTKGTPSNGSSIVVTPNGLNGGAISVYAKNNTYTNILQSDVASLNIPVNPDVLSFVSPSKSNVCLGDNPSSAYQVSYIPNVTSYSWTYPSGWTGPASSTVNNVNVNFNGIAQTGNIVCTAYLPCGKGQSKTTTISVKVDASGPSVPSTAPGTQVANTVNHNKKAVTFTFPAFPTPYGVMTDINNVTYTGGNGISLYYIMTDGDTKNFWYAAQNACANNISDPYSYTLVNGVLVQNEVYRPLGSSAGEEASHEKAIRIFPNPTNGKINISLPSNEDLYSDILVYGVDGTCVYSGKTRSAEQAIDLSNQPQGIYYVKMTKPNGETVNQKVIVTK